MSEYSNNHDDCTVVDENNSVEDIDFSTLDALQFELDNPNGRGTIQHNPHNVAAELAKLDAAFDAIEAELTAADTPACPKSSPDKGDETSDTAIEPCTKSSPSSRRQARKRDRDFLMRARLYAKTERPAEISPALEELTTPSITPPYDHSSEPSAPPNPAPLSTHSLKSIHAIERLFSSYKKSRTPPRWDEASALAKATYYHRVITERGGCSFTLNLSPDVLKAAQADPRSFTEHIRRRVQRALKASFGRGMDFWFGIDVSPEGRPHLHGGIAAPVDEKARLLAALQRAGGKWASVRGVAHQADIGSRLDDEWASYATKAITPSRRKTYGSMISVTQAIGGAARDLFETDRKYVNTYLRSVTVSH